MTLESRIGSVIAGCRVVSEVGRGGMGVVYLAQHLHLQRDVALKVLLPELAADDHFRARFVRESRLAATIDHPSVIPVYDAGETDGVLYISMRYVEGEDLARLIRREAKVPLGRAVDIIDRVGAALDAAHAKGLVHRDVKPANILIGADGGVYLTDFGITRRIDSGTALTAAGFVVGTISYMAPEQFTGREVDGSADLYSLACVFFESLTGRVPFPRATAPAAMFAHLHDEPPRPSAHVAGLPVAVDDVVARALAKEKSDRFTTCGEFAQALRSLVDIEGVRGRRTSVAPGIMPRVTAGRLANRGRWLVGGALASAIVTALVWLLLVDGGDPRRNSATIADGATADAEGFVVIERAGDEVSRVGLRPQATPQPIGDLLPSSSGVGRVEWASPSRNGRFLLMSTERFGCRDFACLAVFDDVEGRADAVRVNDEPLHGVSGAISADGRQVVLESTDGPNERDLWVTRRGTEGWAEPKLVTGRSPHPWNGLPALSLDGASIAFECGSEPYQAPGTSICEVGADGRDVRVRIAPDDRPTGRPTAEVALTHAAYDSDGALYFEGEWSGDQIWVLEAGSDEAVRLETDGPTYAPCPLADGRVVAIMGDRPDGPEEPEVVVIEADGSEVTPIIAVPSVVTVSLRCAG